MVDIEDLKQINFMKDLPRNVLDKVAGVALLENFKEEAILIRQGQAQHQVYMLLSGKIFINCRSTTGRALTLDELKGGQTFGLSSLLDNSLSTYTAICAEDSTLITLSSAQMLKVFKDDYLIGYEFMQQVVEKFKSRMGRHTQRFIDVLSTHPAISAARGA